MCVPVESLLCDQQLISTAYYLYLLLPYNMSGISSGSTIFDLSGAIQNIYHWYCPYLINQEIYVLLIFLICRETYQGYIKVITISVLNRSNQRSRYLIIHSELNVLGNVSFEVYVWGVVFMVNLIGPEQMEKSLIAIDSAKVTLS